MVVFGGECRRTVGVVFAAGNGEVIRGIALIDIEAPLDVLQAMADYRIRTVTQVLENIAYRAEIGCDTVVLSDFSKLLVIPLRDGGDLMDVIGRRLRAQVAG